MLDNVEFDYVYEILENFSDWMKRYGHMFNGICFADTYTGEGVFLLSPSSLKIWTKNIKNAHKMFFPPICGPQD